MASGDSLLYPRSEGSGMRGGSLKFFFGSALQAGRKLIVCAETAGIGWHSANFAVIEILAIPFPGRNGVGKWSNGGAKKKC
jgi:hypothetical protein